MKGNPVFKRIRVALLMLLAGILFLSCSYPARVLVVVDNEKYDYNEKGLINSITNYFMKTHGRSTEYEVMKEPGLMESVKANPAAFTKSHMTRSYSNMPAYIAAVKQINDEEFLVLYGTDASQLERVHVSNDVVISPSDTFNTFKKVYSSKRYDATRDIFLFGRFDRDEEPEEPEEIEQPEEPVVEEPVVTAPPVVAEKQKVKLIVMIDTANFIQWNEGAFIDEISAIVRNSLADSEVMVETIRDRDIFDQLKDSSVEYIKYKMDPNIHKMAFLVGVKPSRNMNTGQIEFDMILASSDSIVYNKKTYEGEFRDPNPVKDKLSSLFMGGEFVHDTAIYQWTTPYIPPAPVKPKVDIDSSVMVYRAYYDAIKLNGKYIMIREIPDTFVDGELRVEELLDRGSRFYPESNRHTTDIITYFEDNYLSDLFYTTGGARNRKYLIFAEYYTTGDRYVKLLYGPIANNREFEEFKAMFAESEIDIFPMLIYTYDFR